MESKHLTIGFVRRGYSATGGAEAYLKRLALGVREAGHSALLYTDADWPPNEWSFGPLIRLKARTPMTFAEQMRRRQPGAECDVLMSLERIWQCDVYRAGDGVHRAWLKRRGEIDGGLRRITDAFNPKHSGILKLERALFAERGAGRVIANSRMVRDEIVRIYGFPAEKIEIVRNGVPLALFRGGFGEREQTRRALGLESGNVAVLFAGSGWERKGLRFAIEAVAKSDERVRLVVAGRGDEKTFNSPRVQFLGPVANMPAVYAAADIFLLPTIYDPFSNACLEALAAGLPVITTKANGFAEIMETGVHGSVLEDPQNIDAMRESIALWSDASRREQAQRRMAELADRFDISANVEQTLRILFQSAASAAST